MRKIVLLLDSLVAQLKAPLKRLIESELLTYTMLQVPYIPKFITKLVIRWTLNKTVNPAIDAAFREMNYQLEVANGTIILKKINNSSNINEWDISTNSV